LTVRRLTSDLRGHIESVRDTAIAIGKEEGLSNRAVAGEVGCSEFTVRQKDGAIKRNASENTHDEPNATKPPTSLFNSLDIKNKLGDDVEIPEDFTFDEDELTATLENGGYTEKKEALKKVDEAGWDTITNNMAKGEKKKLVAKKLTRTERSANAIGSAAGIIQSLEEVNPDLAELTTFIQNDPTAANDLAVLADFIKRLTNSLDMEKNA
jgi:transposase